MREICISFVRKRSLILSREFFIYIVMCSKSHQNALQCSGRDVETSLRCLIPISRVNGGIPMFIAFSTSWRCRSIRVGHGPRSALPTSINIIGIITTLLR